ncbi:MAG TPA: hypothetical protein VFJ58_17005, partial [Armatimonadota bacterium]|nr:hypothetical protein [Armatimonadota bacterium]
VVHHTYKPDMSAAWRPGRIALIAFLGTTAAIWAYTLVAEIPDLPTPGAAKTVAAGQAGYGGPAAHLPTPPRTDYTEAHRA